MSHYDALPSPVVVTDANGCVLELNTELLTLVGGSAQDWLGASMDALLPPASRIFLQTHVWPMLLAAGQVKELQVHVVDVHKQRIPVFLNCSRSEVAGQARYTWLLYIAQDRAEFEAQLLSSRNLTQAYAEAVIKSENFVKTIADNVPGLVAYWDKDLRCKFANKGYQEWFGKSARQVVGLSMVELLGERLFEMNKPYIAGVLSGQAQQFERTLTKADGSIGHTMANYLPDVDAAGNVAGFFVLVSDITKIKKAEIELRLAASVFDSASEGIMVTDRGGTIVSVNAAFTHITGYTAEEAIGQTPRIMKCGRTGADYYKALWQGLLTAGEWKGETWNCRKNGVEYVEHHSMSRIQDADGVVVRYVSIFSDVTERWRKDADIKQRAFHDTLTGLPNRSLLSERVEQMLTLVKREHRSIAVMFLDLDGFKKINDTQGHAVGDADLLATAKRLLGLVRQSDVVARLGGDEFVVVLDNPANVKEVALVAARIVALVGEAIQVGEVAVKVGVSIGISMCPADGDGSAVLFEGADKAMYAAKAAGKNTFRFAAGEVAIAT
jgi:diguanylate cyclase (GGDEF)-like protein/PAS domain S-box-containing protein